MGREMHFSKVFVDVVVVHLPETDGERRRKRNVRVNVKVVVIARSSPVFLLVESKTICSEVIWLPEKSMKPFFNLICIFLEMETMIFPLKSLL